MFWILDKSKRKVAPFEDHEDFTITTKLDMGDKTLSFTAAIIDIADKVELEGYIETKDQEYVIREITKQNNGKIQVVAQLNLEDLEGKTFRTFYSTTKTVEEAIRLAIAGTGWTLDTIDVTKPNKKRTIALDLSSSFKILKQIASTYRVNFVFNAKQRSMSVYDIDRIGSDRGMYFTDELNLRSLTVNSNSYEFYTELEAYGKDGLTFKDINDNKNYVTNHTYSDKVKRFIWKDERYTDKESLLEDSIAKLNDMSKPYVSYNATIIDLSKASHGEYSGLEYAIGDTITLIDSITGTKEKQRIVEIQEHPDDPEKNTATLANTTLTFEELTQKYNNTSDTVSNITSTNGQVSNDAIEKVDSKKLTDLDTVLPTTQTISTLIADSAHIGGELTATVARVGTLEANVGSFEELTTQNFSAVRAQITELDTTKLSAATARIETLEGDYANIKTIMTGNVGAGDITTIVLNANNAVIDSQFIRNLVAQNVTVNDLLAGFISTTRFTVGSDTGNLRIEDNTISIKDSEDHVRVQIGEDATGNYSIIVYDATGSGQLFNQNGITESGIADGLIKNAKVANDANISATKLDISSLFSVINEAGTGYTIQGTKVYLDEQSQSLSAAFTQMSSNVSAASNNANQAIANSQTALNAANEAMKVVSGIDSLNALGMMLTNDAHVVHTYADGTGGVYTECKTSPIVFLGELDVTAMTVFTVLPSSGVTGTWTDSTKVYQVSNMTTNDGYVDFRGVYGSGDRYLCSKGGARYTTRSGKKLLVRSGGTEVKKRFSISKSPDGRVGLSYILRPSVVALTRAAGEETVVFNPANVTFSSYENESGTITPLSCRFKIEESTDFTRFTEKVAYGTARTSYTYTPTQTSDLVCIRCTIKDATEDVVLDSQTVLVLANADSLADRVEDAEASVIEFNDKVGRFENTINGMTETLQNMHTEVTGAYANNLLYQFDWTTNANTTTLVAHVYIVDPESKRTTEVTNNYDDVFFSWTRKSDEAVANGEFADIPLGTGKRIVVNNSDFGLNGNIDGWFYPYLPSYLTTRSGKKLTTRSGKRFTTYTN